MRLWAVSLIGVATFAATGLGQTTVTIEKVVRSSGNSIYDRDMTLTDEVPGRALPFVFWSSSDPTAPVINESGEVVFKGFSASRFNVNTGGEFGLYVKRPGEAMAVLVDTTDDDDGNPTFPVPEHPGFHFSHLDPPLLNNAGDVVFLARFGQVVTPFQSGWGLYSTTTTGGPITKIVDTFDPVAGHSATTRFESFQFTANNSSTFAVSANDAGQVVYWGQFCDSPPCTSTSRRNGLFGTTVSGLAHALLADSSKTICPADNPVGVTCDPSLSQGFAEIRPEKGINSSGDVAFHGSIRNTLHGTYSVHVTGGPITTVAFRGQLAPPSGLASYLDRFDNVELNDSGAYIFQPLLSAPCCVQRFGHFAGSVLGGPHTRIVDTLDSNGIVVPGEIAGAEFQSIASVSINESGQMGFYGAIRNGGIANNNGIYAASTDGGPFQLVMDGGSIAPGLPAPARITSFQGQSAAINDGGHMAFWGSGLDDQNAALRGLYFYDSCEGQVVRIADSTTALADLGVSFGGVGSSLFDLYQGGEARSGQYKSINNNNEVAFLAKFSNFGMGLYVARVDVAGGGAVTIDCPASLTLECPADTSPAAAGEATAGGCGAISVSYTDSSVAGCGTTETITRTWTADNGAGGTASCVQTISVADTTAPSLVGVPTDANAECDAVPAAASVTAVDGCDANPDVAFEELNLPGSCPNNYLLIRTWTATDACGNVATADQAIGVADTVAPVITCPPDAMGLECPADTSIAARGSASATDACGGVAVTSSDASVPGPGATETITRTWTATDDCGHSTSCDQLIQVVDTTAPAVTCGVTTGVLWSPDHELIPVGLATNVDDGCDDLTAEGSVTVQVWSDETEIPDTGDGTGRHAPDAKDIDTGLRLRNERRATENGRVYLIIARAEDGSGNVGFGTCSVVVPHDQSAEGEGMVAAEAAAAEASVASAAGTTIAEKIAALVAQGWSQHGISAELGPKQ